MLQPHQQPTRWDRDCNRIPDGQDRVFNLVWDRNVDGATDRYDYRDNPRHDHDSNGVPNWHGNPPRRRR